MTQDSNNQTLQPWADFDKTPTTTFTLGEPVLVSLPPHPTPSAQEEGGRITGIRYGCGHQVSAPCGFQPSQIVRGIVVGFEASEEGTTAIVMTNAIAIHVPLDWLIKPKGKRQ